jgi:flavin-dependent dehydrogenase
VTSVDVAVVGGGPAGAIAAARLARAGHEVLLIERSPGYRWRACGVFSSPATTLALAATGLSPATIARMTRPIPAMRVETPAGTSFRLTYRRDGSAPDSPVGFDRSALDPALLDAAVEAGVTVCRGWNALRLETSRHGVRIVLTEASARRTVDARLIIGADGIRSVVAREVGVARHPRLAPRTGMTFHLEDDDAGAGTPRDARMHVLRDGYVGIAPVPEGRVNVGIVLGRSWASTLRSEGAGPVVERIVASIPATADDPARWRHGRRLDRIAGASPIGHRVTRRAGPGWLLAGDAAGFLDPFTGEGLHRAIVSASLAASAGAAWLGGERNALAAYDRAMRRRFASKDVVSWLVQGFLERPALFEYAARRLARRDEVRTTLGLVMGDLVPARRGLDPRFLGALLAP